MTFVVLAAALLGALVGSFANVVVHRLPRGESIAFPPSHCPQCHRRLRPWELVPVLSYLAQRGRCRGCGARISPRYAVVEAVTALGFGALAWRWPPLESAAAPLLALGFTVVVIAAFIDIDTFELPDVLTLPGTAAMLLAAFLWPAGEGLPSPLEAALGAAVGAGAIALVNRLGALVLRRFRDTRERLWPLGFDAVNLGALAGALGGYAVGIAAAAGSVLINLVARRVVRLPEPWLYLGWALALAASGATVGPVRAVAGSVAAAGTAALAGAVTWWIHDLATRCRGDAERDAATGADGAPPGDGASEDDEPVAMGFGDVKLAALLGAVLGWERLLVGLFLAVLVGAIGGLLARALGGGRMVPFGPYLALGGILAFAFGDALIRGYLGMLGVA